MGTGYTRNDTANNIADGNVINASDLDGEFDAVEAAFNSSTGHTHDGTSAEGAAITVLGPTQEFVATANEVRPSTNNGLNLGTALVQFNELYASGTATLGDILIDDGATIGSDSDADAITISSGGNVTFSQTATVDVESATTNAVINTLNLKAQSSGTPAVGIGTGMQLQVETAAGNVETGGAIRIITTGLTPTDEETDLVFYSMRNGSLTEAFRFDSSADGLDVTGTVTADGLTVNNISVDGNTVSSTTGALAFEAAGTFTLDTNSVERLRIASNGDISFYEDTGTTAKFFWDASAGSLGIGTSSPAGILDVASGDVILQQSNDLKWMNTARDTTYGAIEGLAAGTLFKFGGSEVMRIDSSGNLLINHDTSTALGSEMKLQVIGTDAGSGISITRHQSTAGGPSLRFGKSRTSTKGDVTIVQDDDVLGTINFYGADGTALDSIGAQIQASVDGTPGASDMPGRLVFKTTADGASSSTERMRITSQGRIGIGIAAPEQIIHVVASGSDDAKIILENENNPRGNYIGMEGSDNIEIAADEDNVGTDSTIKFRVDASEKMRITSGGKLLINKTVEQPATNAPPTFIEAHDATGASMLLSRSDTTVAAGNNVGAYLFRTGDSSGVKYGGMVSRGRNTTGDAYVGFYSVDGRLQAGSDPDHVMLENLDFYSRAGAHFVGYNVLGGTYSSNEDGFYAYHNGSGTGDSYLFLRTRDGTGSDYVLRHARRGTIKSEIEEDGSFHSAPNSYGGTSDERLKENITASGSQWDDIKAVQVKKYSWIEEGLDAPNQLGVIAQDLMASGMNGLVQQHFKTNMNPETKEDEPVLDAEGNQEEFYTVKYSVLYMKAIKALQEAMERIETLETEQTAIKARLDALEAT